MNGGNRENERRKKKSKQMKKEIKAGEKKTKWLQEKKKLNGKRINTAAEN